MAKLPNIRQSLDAIVAMPDGRTFGEAELVAVSYLPNKRELAYDGVKFHYVRDPPLHGMRPGLEAAGSFDPKGVRWKTHVMNDYLVQKAAIAGRVIKKAAALPPHFALDILRGNDPNDDNYSVMGILVPSKIHSHGIEMIGIIRPDVVKFKDGEPHVKLWFNALVNPAYNRAGNEAYLTSAGRPLVTDALVNAAMKRMEPVAGNDALVFSDDQCSSSVDDLVNRHGFNVLLEDVQVSSLPEKRKSRLDTAVGSVTLLVKPNKAYVNGMPPDKASEMVKNYLVDGYDAPGNGKLVRQAMAQLKAQTLGGLVQYR